MITKFNFQDHTIKSYAIRKLTPLECFRLMGVRDGIIHIMQSTIAQAKERVTDFLTHRKGKPYEPNEAMKELFSSIKGKDTDMLISSSQQYKQAGNSIVVDVLAAIYEQLWFPKEPKKQAQASFMDMFFPEDVLPDMPVEGVTDNEKVIITTFSGYDSQLMAAEALRERHPRFHYTCRGWSDIDKYACQMHNLVFPQYADQALGDITKIDWHKVKDGLQGREVDLFTYSSPCFVAGTLVHTTQGLKSIEKVSSTDSVITHSGAYQRVLKVGSKMADEIVCVKGMCIDEILCTPNHPFYVREMYRYGHKWKRAFRNPQWKEAGKLTRKDYMGIAINRLNRVPDWDGTILHYGGRDSYQVNKIGEMLESYDFWYLMGRYVGDGWTRDDELHKQVCIACSDRNEPALKQVLDTLSFNPTVTDTDKSCRRYTINSKELMEFVDRYGHGAINKCIDFDTLSLPVNLLVNFLIGYTDSDGCRDKKNGEYKIATVSRVLAYGIQQIVAKVYHRPARVYKVSMPSKTKIDGREVNQNDFYQVVWHIDARKQDKAFYEDGYIWYPCTGVETTDRKERVYNMEVETDNSYTANGTIVHNCQDISQAGKQMGLQEGSDTRSALLWRVADAVEVLRPKYLLQENVAALVSEKFMPDFKKWLDRLEQMGYVNRWARLNAKDYGVPQNRDRVFCLSMRRDVAFNYQFPEPVKLERRLEDVLEEEVDEKYFLKDSAVEKFLKANDSDKALFIAFDAKPTHEDAMFLKTWLQYFMERNNGWDMKPTELEDLINGKGMEKGKFLFDYALWSKDSTMPTRFGNGFEERFRENMNHKPNV